MLTCEANGATAYNWEKQNGRVPFDAIGVNTNMLTIKKLQLKDLGRYRCVATNDSGRNVSEFAELIVNSKAVILVYV